MGPHRRRTQDIITDLSHSRDVLVVAPNSSDRYKDMDVDAQKVGRDLGVKYLLQGSLQASGDKLRITSQLLDANTGTHIWSVSGVPITPWRRNSVRTPKRPRYCSSLQDKAA